MNDHPESTDFRSLLENAYLELREMRSELEAVEQAEKEPVAIIGMGCRLPQIKNPSALWQLLCEGRSVITEVPASRWDMDELFDPEPQSKGKIASRWGGFLEDLDSFDAAFFSISSREAPHVDPRQRLLLEVAWEALEDAGIPPYELAGSRTGVYIATLNNDYDFVFSHDYGLVESFTGAGTANSVAANRLSYFLDLRGPSLSLDTACSGSLLAVELACRSLRRGETTLALAGGVSVNLLPKGDIFFSRAGALSPDGRCQAFDGDANGIVRSEGTGVIVLKSLSKALADGDRIYALIRGGAVNHNGRSNGIMAPNGLAQEALLREAYRQAGVSPGKVQYVEAHGTGTRLGDPIEVNTLTEVLATERPTDRPCALGSVKTNVGHLEAAAGVVGIIKTALSLHHRLIPPTLHFKELNPLIRPTDFPLRVQQRLEAWPMDDEPLIAGVSSFGFGGTNVHLVLEEAPRAVPEPDLAAQAAHVLPLSAQSEKALRSVAESYQRFLAEEGNEESLHDICYTASVRRSFHDHRLAVTGHTREELLAELEAFTRDETTQAATEVDTAHSQPARLVYVFSGQGTHWRGMGGELIEQEPIFARVIQECEQLLGRDVDWSLTEQLRARDGDSRLHETDVAQPAIFAVQVALAALWRSWGLVPDVIVGQSLGEVAAAHVAGALSLEDALRVVFHRSRLMKRMAGQGRTAVVGLGLQQSQQVLTDFVDRLAVAGSLGPAASVISGEPSALEHILGTLRSRDVFCRLIENGDLAFHSPQMNEIKAELMQAVKAVKPMPASVQLISTVTGTPLEGEALDAGYWGRNLREPFRFAEVMTNLIADGYGCFLEISPHPALVSSIHQCLTQQDHQGIALPSLVRDKEERFIMLSSLARLYMQGHDVNWKALYPAGGRCVSLPTYSWQREHYWYDQLESERPASRSFFAPARKAGLHPLLGEHFQSALSSGQQFWEIDLNFQSLAYLKDHSLAGAVVFPGAAYLEMALAAASQTFEGDAFVIEEVSFERALIIEEDEPLKLQLVLSPAANGGEASFQIYSQPSRAESRLSSWTLHASGKMRHLPFDNASHPPDVISLERLQAHCTQPISADEHYAAMRARQLRYGPGFRVIERLWRREGETLSRHELSESLRAGGASYHVHPVMLDAGFQVVAATLPEMDDGLYLPQGVERLRIHRRAGARTWCHARLRPDARPGASLLKADIRFFDDEGRVSVEVEGLCLRRIDATRQVRINDPKDFLYEVQWQPQPKADSTGRKLNDTPATYLLFTDGGELCEQLASILEARSHTCVRIHAAQHYRISEDKRTCWINPRDPQQFQRLFSDVLTDDLPACRAIVHLWGLAAPSSEETTCRELEAAQALGCEALLHITQALTSNHLRRSARLWIVTGRAQPAGARSTDVAFAQSGLWGMGRVVAAEHPELWGGLIDLDLDDARRDAELLDEEMLEPGQEREVAYSAGQRHVARLKRKRLPATTQPYQFRVDASYLITGGLSGLGLETARWMIRQGARRVILLGRTALPLRSGWSELVEGTAEAGRVAEILELERMGASVDACAVDVSDEAQLREFLERHRREGWPPIRGVVHAAGVIRDQLLMNMEVGAFREVLKPKLYGGWLLHKMVEREPLDFFVMYSSASSVMGRTGQANYAAANALLDGLAYYRRGLGLPALSVNWGPWSEVGMYARVGLSERSGAEGVEEISPKQGAELLSLLVGSSAVEAVVLNADWTKFKASTLLSELVSKGSDREATRAGERQDQALALEMLLASEVERRAMLAEYLKKAVGQVLRCDASHVNQSSVLAGLGMDSIMAVELKNSITADLNLSVSLAELFTDSVSKLVEKLDAQLQNDERLAAAVAEIEQLSLDEVFVQLDSEDRKDQERASGSEW